MFLERCKEGNSFLIKLHKFYLTSKKKEKKKNSWSSLFFALGPRISRLPRFLVNND